MILIALALLAQQDVPTVTMHTKDGNALTGPINVTDFKIESSLGTIDLKISQISRLQFAEGVCTAVLQDGTTLKGKINVESWKVTTKVGEFTIKTSDLQMISWAGMRRVESPAPAEKLPAKPAEAAPGLKPVRTFGVKAVIAQIVASPDGKKLYALDASESKLLVIDPETLKKTSEIALSGGETAMTLMPSGTAVAAAGKRTITVVGLAEGKITKTFQVEMEVRGLCAVDDHTLLVSGGQVALVSIPKQGIVAKYSGASADRLTYVPALRKVYSRSGVLLPADPARGSEPKWAGFMNSASGELSFSPDGRFAVSQFGEVYRMGKSFIADMAVLGKTEQHISAAWRPSQKRVLLFTAQGFVKEFDTETWELAKSWEIGAFVFHPVIDDAKSLLHVFATPVTPGRSPPQDGRPRDAGDLHTYELPK